PTPTFGRRPVLGGCAALRAAPHRRAERRDRASPARRRSRRSDAGPITRPNAGRTCDRGAIVRKTFPIAVLLILGAASCGSHAEHASRVPLTERQRDSIIAKSSLPGASVVGRALDVSDKAAARADGMAAADSMFH